MSFSVNISGHIAGQDSDGSTPVQTPAEIEAELADRLHVILREPKYGVSAATLYGQHGTVSLVTHHAEATADTPGSDGE